MSMALPNMVPRLTARKNIYEQIIVSRRDKEDNYNRNWNNNSNYFKNADVLSSKISDWTSSKSFNRSLTSYQNKIDEKAKFKRLDDRRQRLAKLYEEERSAFQSELAAKTPESSRSLASMRERVEGLQSAREESRKQVVANKFYDHWRLNSPEVRQLEFDQHKAHVVQSWKGQVEENEQRKEELRQENEKLESQLEIERINALEKEKDAKTERAENQKRFEEKLRCQIAELRAREDETKRFKLEEQKLIAHQNEVSKLEEIQNRKARESKKKEFGRLLVKQHVAQMKRKSQLVQEELNQDIKMLENLVEYEKDEAEIRLVKRDQLKADASWMMKILDEQMKLEKLRETESEMIYQHEAARMWAKREEEWSKEREARQRLMKEVLETRQHQIEDRLLEIHSERQKSLDERECLIQEIELANQMTERDRIASIEVKTARQKELQEQISSRQEAKENEKLKLKLDFDELQQDQCEQEELLQQQTERMKLDGFRPRSYGRRKQAWS